MENVLAGFALVFTPGNLLLVCAATVVGVIFGALPGISSAMAMALVVPFTYVMEPVNAVVFLTATYCASITGGGITAILFKIPGTPSSAVTTFDGYPMAAAGKASKALAYSLVCSGIGGMISAVALILVSPQLARLGLKFGPSELFAVSFFGLSVLSCLNPDNLLKTLISGFIGLFLACVGLDPMNGDVRFTWGHTSLISGIEMIPVMIGIFAITEVFKQTLHPVVLESTSQTKKLKMELLSFREIWDIKGTILRSGLLGTFVGILPGAGSTIASFLSYGAEVKISKNPEKFGTGCPEGIAASETANNAATGGSLVPLLTLGIPGGNSAAIMMSALIMQGVTLGPILMSKQPIYLSSTFAAMIFTNIFMVVVSLFVAKGFGKITDIPYALLGTLILVFACVGSYSLQNNLDDVMLMVISGVLGYAFLKCGFSPAALVLGLVLGSLCEANLRRAIALESGNVMKALFIGKPITATLLTLCMLMIIVPVIAGRLKKK